MVKKQSILNDKPSTVMGYPLTIRQQICLCFLLPSIINCIIYILDISTCVSAVREHFEAGLHVWAVFTIILLYLPSIVFFVLTVSKPDLWDEQGDIVRTGQWFLFRLAQLVAFPIWAIYRYAKQLFWSIEALIREDPLREEALQEVIEPSQIELYLYLQAFLQCAPQAVLQIFIMLYAYKLGIQISTFPIDTTKTRLQIQGQKTDSKYAELKYRGMTHALLQISKQEGVRALYSGIGPAVLRQATYGTIKFGTYYSLKHLTVKANGEEDVALNVCCAVVAGMVSSAIANPTDVLKVRMQVLGTQSSRGIVGCFQEVYHHEGVAGLWRGVGPTSQRAAVIAAVELPVYDFCKQHLMTTFGDRVSNHFISSFIASLGSAVASTPIDVVRTRLMNQRKLKTTSGGASTLHIYSGSVDCLAQTVKNEGLLALYKGFIPTWVRMGPWNIIFFVTYEQLKKFY